MLQGRIQPTAVEFYVNFAAWFDNSAVFPRTCTPCNRNNTTCNHSIDLIARNACQEKKQLKQQRRHGGATMQLASTPAKRAGKHFFGKGITRHARFRAIFNFRRTLQLLANMDIRFLPDCFITFACMALVFYLSFNRMDDGAALRRRAARSDTRWEVALPRCTQSFFSTDTQTRQIIPDSTLWH